MTEYPKPIGQIRGNIVGFIQDGATRIYISDAYYANKTKEQQEAARQHFMDVCALVAGRQAVQAAQP